MTPELKAALQALLDEVENYAGEPGYYDLLKAGEEVARLFAKVVQNEPQIDSLS